MAILHGDDMRNGMLAGVDALADVVKSTLGPRGRYVAMPQKSNAYGADYTDAAAPDAPVLVTNDGVTIAKSITLPDPVQNMGAQLVKQAAMAANDAAGDGTTTAIVLAQAILGEAFRTITAGADPLALRRGIQAAGKAAREALQESAVPVSSQEDLERVATVSCRDSNLGALIAEALARTGEDGVVNVDDSRTWETTLDMQDGIVFDRGLKSPHMATDVARGIAELENPYILLTDLKAQSQADLLDALICAAEDGRDMLIVSDGVEGEALALVLGNNREGGMHVACVDAPEYGEGRRWRLEDLAVQTGATFITGDAGMTLGGVTRDMLGTAEHVTVTQKRTTITGGGGDPKAIADRVSQLRYYVENTDYEFNRKRHAERLARFVSGVATIRVGASTEGEQWERKMLVEDALAAAEAARAGGVVPGGGVALVSASAAADTVAGNLSGDEARGAHIAAGAFRVPLQQIAKNAGKEGSVVLDAVLARRSGEGYDAAHDRYVDMMQAGIIDPLAVTNSALEAALSIAGTALLTEAGIMGEADE